MMRGPGSRVASPSRGSVPMTSAEPELLGGPSEEPLGGASEEPLAGAVDQAEFALVVEGEDGDVDLGHDLAQQGGRLEGIESLLAQRLAEGTDLAEGEAEGVVGRAAGGRAH